MVHQAKLLMEHGRGYSAYLHKTRSNPKFFYQNNFFGSIFQKPLANIALANPFRDSYHFYAACLFFVYRALALNHWSAARDDFLVF